MWGNHDRARHKDIRPLEQALAASGVTVLTNRGVPLRDDFYLAGVDDLWEGVPDARRALQARPAAAACLLLCHHPDVLPHVPAEVGLTLCGHTHGGQVRFPLIGAPYTSSAYGERFAMGLIEEPVRAFVSRGLGVSMLPLRLLCPAEVVTLELVPAGLVV